ncbi:MAG: phage holin [Anaerovoracaceae bacterium]
MRENNISTGTIIRTVVLIVALINQVLTMTGHSVLPFDEQQITDGLSMLFTVAAALWAWWKNNSFTKAAQAADVYLRAAKDDK